MSTLHKQNFDLKLELFHRRERQTVLEEQIELLEASKTQAEETSATLLQELEKRDKAVSEAVHMIISLETRIDLLLREREMIRQLESDRAFMSHLSQSPSTTLVSHAETTKDNLTSDRKRLFQAPSFMSGQTESLEAFRQAGPDSDASHLSLLKMDSTAGSDHGFATPSILSESSFVSIYGQGDTRDSSVPPDIPINASRNIKSEMRGRRSISASTRDFRPSRSRRIESLGSLEGARSAMDNQDMSTPLKKLERLDTASNNHNTGAQVVSATHGADRSETVRPLKQQPLMRPHGHKDRPGRKIISDESTTTNDHTLPPTPDTATSSVLHHGHNHSDRPVVEQSSSPTSHLTLKRFPGEPTEKIAPNQWRFQDTDLLSPHAPSFTAFTGRKQLSNAAFPDIHSPRLRRPRSADETTISRHKNGWESESEFDDAVSEVSSFDYWVKEGLRPSRGGAAQLNSSHTASNRDTPELFGFPSDENGDWRSDDLFGALGGIGYLGANGPSAPALDAMGASLPSPEAGLYGSGLAGTSLPRSVGSSFVPPPAPYRKSSLNARTSAPGTPEMIQSSGKFQDNGAGKKRSVSGHIQKSNEWTAPSSRSQTPTLPARTQHQQPEHPAQKDTQKRHYPPQASQQHQQAAARPRGRGITSLFRRSLGSGPILPTSASVPAAESPFAPPLTREFQASQVGVPTWERRNDLVGDMPSATPPPIMRKKGPAGNVETDSGAQLEGTAPVSTNISGRGNSMDVPALGLGAGLSRVFTSEEGGGAPLAHRAALRQSHEMSFPPPSHGHGYGHGHGRKWFGLGRMTSFRHVGS